jgi:hypothetical protein
MGAFKELQLRISNGAGTPSAARSAASQLIREQSGDSFDGGFRNPYVLAQLLGGEAQGDQILAPGPGHSAYDRSLSIRIDPTTPDGFVCHSFAGDDWVDCKVYVLDEIEKALMAQEQALFDRLMAMTVEEREAEWNSWKEIRGGPRTKADRLWRPKAIPPPRSRHRPS